VLIEKCMCWCFIDYWSVKQFTTSCSRTSYDCVTSPVICIVNFKATYLLTHCSVCCLTPAHTLFQYLYLNSRWTATIIIERNLRLSQRRRNRLKCSGKTLMINHHHSFTREASHFGSPTDKQGDTTDHVYSAVS